MPVAEFPERRFPPPWTVEELDACLSATTADRHSPSSLLKNLARAKGW